MKILITTLLSLILLTGCLSTPEPEEVIRIVYKESNPITVPVKHPTLPDSLPIPNIEYSVSTVKTLIETLKGTVTSSNELTKDDKAAIVETLDIVQILQLNKDPLIRYSLDSASANSMSVYTEQLITTLEAYKIIIEHYRAQDAVILVK